MSVNIALRRTTNLRRDPSPHATKTNTIATKAMRNPKKLVDPLLLVGLAVDFGLDDEVVVGVLVEDIVECPDGPIDDSSRLSTILRQLHISRPAGLSDSALYCCLKFKLCSDHQMRYTVT